VQAHNNLGVALIRQGKVDEAIRSFSGALQIRPDYAEASHNLKTALQIASELDSAPNSTENL
jgi:tetratricopeptide (TPR) repeat protein